jgi:hypothetical protein
MDLDIRGYIIFTTGHHNMALRCDVSAPTLSLLIYLDETQSYLNMCYQFVVDCTATDPSRTASGLVYGIWAKSALLGGSYDVAGQHVVRFTNSYACELSHAAFKRPLGTKHCLKMHGAYTGNTPAIWDEVSNSPAQGNTTNNGTGMATLYNIVRDTIGGTTDSLQDWTYAVDPENDTGGAQIEGVSDIILENNKFHTNSSPSRKDITRGGRRITSRGNTNIESTFILDQGENSTNIPSGWNGPYLNT